MVQRRSKDHVTPTRHTDERVFVTGEGGWPMRSGNERRIAELEAENQQLRSQLEQLMRVHETDREHLRSIRTLAALRLEDSID